MHYNGEKPKANVKTKYNFGSFGSKSQICPHKNDASFITNFKATNGDLGVKQ